MTTIPRPMVRVNQWSIIISVILSILTQQIWILWIPLSAGLSSLLFKVHPIMLLAKAFLKKPLESYVQEDVQQQRFNQILAVTMLSASVLSYMLNWVILSYVFAMMVFLACAIAIGGFCIGCFIYYQISQYKYRRSLKV